jgi:hypothetical protein
MYYDVRAPGGRDGWEVIAQFISSKEDALKMGAIMSYNGNRSKAIVSILDKKWKRFYFKNGVQVLKKEFNS